MERYQVELKDFPGEEIAFIKSLRIIGKISLLDATRIFDYASNTKGVVLVAGVDKTVADHIAKTFADVHIRVSVRSCPIPTPMICRPQANALFKWSGLRSVVTA